MPSIQCNALVTCSGRKSFFLEILKRAPNAGLIVSTDSDPLATTRSKNEHFYRVSAVDDERYITELLAICEQEAIDCVIPTNDLDLVILARNTSAFADIGVRVLGAGVETAEILADKLAFTEWLKQFGLVGPPAILAADAEVLLQEFGFPLIAKARRGQASDGLSRCETHDELNLVPPDAVVQPLISGMEYNLDILRCPDSGVVSVIPKFKLKMYQGATDKAVTVDEPDLIDLGLKIGDAVRHSGGIDVDVMVNESRETVILDINPRIGGGFPTASIACPEYVDALLAIGAGHVVPPFLGQYEREVTVYRDVYYLKVEKVT